jgi:hypothetical protein
MRQTDKNTFSGREIREYKCDRCGHEDWEDCGTALWQILHDDREEFEAAEAARAAAGASASQPNAAAPKQEARVSLWRRLAAFFQKSR